MATFGRIGALIFLNRCTRFSISGWVFATKPPRRIVSATIFHRPAKDAFELFLDPASSGNSACGGFLALILCLASPCETKKSRHHHHQVLILPIVPVFDYNRARHFPRQSSLDMIRSFAFTLLFIAAVSAFSVSNIHAAKPNIIYILLDDAGYGSVLLWSAEIQDAQHGPFGYRGNEVLGSLQRQHRLCADTLFVVNRTSHWPHLCAWQSRSSTRRPSGDARRYRHDPTVVKASRLYDRCVW